MRHLTTLRFIDEVAKARSIRKAAEILSVTPSALNRRILQLEEELGAPIFERLARGVRLNTAGEMFINLVRRQISETNMIRSQIADLSGIRRGHVSIAGPQPVLRSFIPAQIESYRSQHPEVTFDVWVRSGFAAEQALASYVADMVILAEPPHLAEFETTLTIEQPIFVIVPINHPLANKTNLRLSECFQHPLALPPRLNALRDTIERLAAKRNQLLNVVIQSDSYEFLLNCIVRELAISFHLQIGLPHEFSFPGVISIPLNQKDAPPVKLYLGKLRNRSLSVAASRFSEQIITACMSKFNCY